MTVEAITEEQEQIKRIIKRWHIATRTYVGVAFGLLLLTMLLFLYNIVFAWLDWNFVTFMFIGKVVPTVGIASIGAFVAAYIKRLAFLRRLTKQEIDLLGHTNEILGDKSNKTAVVILNSHRNSGYIPQEELLRASIKAEDETLLRAAASTDTTPQEQLLRPSQTTEE